VPAAYYAVYRFDGDVPATSAGSCDFADARNLAGTARAAGGPGGPAMTWQDATAVPGRTYTYFLTAVDRLHHESVPGNPVTARAI
jgi:hypothetical protein